MPIKLKIKVGQVGNSLRITLPKPVTEPLNIKKGDVLLISLDGDKIVVEKVPQTKM